MRSRRAKSIGIGGEGAKSAPSSRPDRTHHALARCFGIGIGREDSSKSSCSRFSFVWDTERALPVSNCPNISDCRLLFCHNHDTKWKLWFANFVFFKEEICLYNHSFGCKLKRRFIDDMLHSCLPPSVRHGECEKCLFFPNGDQMVFTISRARNLECSTTSPFSTISSRIK